MQCVLLAGLLGCSLVMAQTRGSVYRWIDNDGQVHYSRILPPEYADLPYQKLNEAGIVVDSIAGALTDEQLVQLATAKLQAEEEKKLQEIRDRQNRALLVRYPTMLAMEESLAFNLERVGGDILIAQSMFDTHVENLVKEVRRAADLQRSGGVIDPHLHAVIGNMRAGIAIRQEKIDTLQLSMELVKNRYESDKNRYRGIKKNR